MKVEFRMEVDAPAERLWDTGSAPLVTSSIVFEMLSCYTSRCLELLEVWL